MSENELKQPVAQVPVWGAGQQTRKRPLHRQNRSKFSLWLIPKPVDLVSSLLYLAILLLFVYYHFSPIGSNADNFWQKSTYITVGMIVLLAIDRLEYWFYGEDAPRVMAALLLLLRIVLIEAVAQVENNFYFFLYLVLPFIAALYFGNKVAYILAFVVWIMYVIKLTLGQPDWYLHYQQVFYCSIYTIGLIFAITIGRVVINERYSRKRTEQLLAELEVSHQKLKEYAEEVAELSTTRERNRLARDIHDSLGHYLTVINVQLEKALAFRNKKPEEADRAISDAKRLASEALQDVRRSVGALRAAGEVFSFRTSINELIENMKEGQLSVEFTINLSIEGSEDDYSKQTLMTLYRAVQETMTNIRKHAGATHVDIALNFGSEKAILTIKDNGCGFAADNLPNLQPGRDRGYGLLGAQERLELVGGYLKLDSKPGEGTSVLITVPRHHLIANGA